MEWILEEVINNSQLSEANNIAWYGDLGKASQTFEQDLV